MNFRLRGLPAQHFAHWFTLSDDELVARHASRVVADRPNAFPCRISLTDAEPGESVILLNYEHQPADSPYRSSHAIYIRQGEQQYDACDAVPDQLRRRLLSVRAFDEKHWLRNADVTPGTALEKLIERLFDDPQVLYLHIHFARFGCYAARVDRV